MSDPVCGMDVDPATAAAAWEHDGTTYYFCSLGCFERFRADPDTIVGSDPSTRSM
jgi:YHS domain-containing protein